MPIRAESLNSQLERGLAAVYLVAGAEVLLVQECADAIRRKAREQGFAERLVLFAERGFNWQELAQAAESQSLFAEGKIIELRIPTGKPGKEGSAAIVDYLAGDDGSNVLLVTCYDMDKARSRSKWVKELESHGVFVQIWPVKPHELPGWISQRMRSLGMNPDNAAVQMLAARLEGNLLAANQEIQKLKLLKGSGSISTSDIQECVADSASFNVFRLIECAELGQLRQALRIVAGLRVSGAELPALVGALTRELGLLERIAQMIAAGLPPAAAFKREQIWQSRQKPMEAILGRLSSDDLQACTQLLAKLDRQSKGAEDSDPWITLDDLVSRLSSTAAVPA